jgi:hypothetical protein
MKCLKVAAVAALFTAALLSFRVRSGRPLVDFGAPVLMLCATAAAARRAAPDAQ